MRVGNWEYVFGREKNPAMVIYINRYPCIGASLMKTPRKEGASISRDGAPLRGLGSADPNEKWNFVTD